MDGDGAPKHKDLHPAALKKDWQSFITAYIWFAENADFECTDDADVFISLSTGLISDRKTDHVNPEQYEEVGTLILDSQTQTSRISTRQKVTYRK